MLHLIKKIFEFLPGKVPEYLYTTVFKPKPIKKIINRILLSIIPDKITLPFGRVLFLNKKDPVVSGALALGVYENFEAILFQKEIQQGMTVLDMGANLGYYTVMFAHLVGPSGKVIAFEPDPQSGVVLKKNILANEFHNVSFVEKALSDHTGFIKLYVSIENRGDNRIYDTKDGRESIEVEMVSLDDYLPKDTKIDLIKMDVQGAESLILSGMEKTIKRSSPLIIFTEFWPKAIIETGKSPENFLQKLIDLGFTLHFINDNKKCIEKIINIKNFTSKYKGREFANLLCYKK